MRFSIICPVYNSEEYLSKTLDSLCLQKFTDYEIICINDGSTDNSLRILEEYQRGYPQLYIHTQKNAGPSAARNKGLELAKGEYILFCDSDDWFERDTILSELDSYIKLQNQIVDVVYFPGNTNWGGNTAICADFPIESFTSGSQLTSRYCMIGSFLLFGTIYAFCYRTEVIQKNRLKFDHTLKCGEDILWTFRFLEKTLFCITYPKPCYFYNVRPNSIMTSPLLFQRRIQDDLRLSHILLEEHFSDKDIIIKRYIAKRYLSAIQHHLSANMEIQIKYRIKLLYSITSIKSFAKLVVLYLSPKLYKYILKL